MNALTKWIFLSLFPSVKLLATLIGNPSQPCLQKTGLFLNWPSWGSLRASYFGDYVYRQHFQNEFQIAGCEEQNSHLQSWTQAGLLTLNFCNRFDLYGIIGGFRMQIKEEMITPQALAWGIGGKIIFLHEGNFRAGLDLKYFQSHQNPKFFQCDHLAYNITSDFYFNYSEVQAALGVAYKSKYVSPYANVSYLIAKLEPQPIQVSVRLPFMDAEADVISKSITGNQRFGLALGLTLIDQKKATLALEWRSFNQNGVDLNCEIRF